jgi:hypothetical protein
MGGRRLFMNHLGLMDTTLWDPHSVRMEWVTLWIATHSIPRVPSLLALGMYCYLVPGYIRFGCGMSLITQPVPMGPVPT